MIGLLTLLAKPFQYLFPLSGGFTSKVLIIGIGAIPAIVVPTLVSISVTLLYFDLRVHTENYNVYRLSQDLGPRSI